MVFNVEDYGVPAYDELIIVANRDAVAEPKIRKFLAALKKATITCRRTHRKPGWHSPKPTRS